MGTCTPATNKNIGYVHNVQLRPDELKSSSKAQAQTTDDQRYEFKLAVAHLRGVRLKKVGRVV